MTTLTGLYSDNFFTTVKNELNTLTANELKAINMVSPTITAEDLILPGFNADGDFVIFERGSTSAGSNTIRYYNNAGALQWTKTAGVEVSGGDTFLGAYYDGTEIYSVVGDETTNPDQLRLVKINSAGTLTDISGSWQAPSAAWDATTNYFSVGYRYSLFKPTGSSNLFLAGSISGGILEINMSTGAIVSESHNGNVSAGSYVLADKRAINLQVVQSNGYYIILEIPRNDPHGFILTGTNSAFNTRRIRQPAGRFNNLCYVAQGVATSGAIQPIDWNGMMYFYDGNINPYASIYAAVSKAKYESSIAEICDYFGAVAYDS